MWTRNLWLSISAKVAFRLAAISPSISSIEATDFTIVDNMGVSKNRGIPKWMVYNGKTLLKLMIWGYHYFWKHPYWEEIKQLKTSSATFLPLQFCWVSFITFANKLTPNHPASKSPPQPQRLYPPNVLPWKFWQSSTQGRTACWEPHIFNLKCLCFHQRKITTFLGSGNPN